MKILLVDNNDDFRGNLKLFLEGHLNHVVVGEASDGKEFLEEKMVPADIVLMDINMPKINGLEAAKMGIWKNHHLKIIALSQYKDSIDLRVLIENGFKGFVSKTNLFKDLDEAIRIVDAGGCYFNDDIQLKEG